MKRECDSKRSTWTRGVPLALLAVLLPLGCGEQKTTPNGELVLAISTDMSTPHDFNWLVVRIDRGGAAPLYDGPFATEQPLSVRVPSAFVGATGNRDVQIEVQALKGSRIVASRLVRTTIPADRAVVLPVTLQALCAGALCLAPETCAFGSCQSSEIPSAALETYSPSMVFGGGEGGVPSRCFDAVGCFQTAVATKVDLSSCTVAASALGVGVDRANFALHQPGIMPGVQFGPDTIVPIDREEGASAGWRVQGSDVTLPSGVCDLLMRNSKARLITTSACEPKRFLVPLCGAQLATADGGSSGVGTVDAGGVTPGSPDAAAPLDGTVGGGSGWPAESGYVGGGTSGRSGAIGGVTGSTGFAGRSGVTGFAGRSGVTGFAGRSGVVEISGRSGSTGISGRSGVAGRTGATGYSGTSGIGPGRATFVNESGWYAADSNVWGIQGAAYAYSDGSSVWVPDRGRGNPWDEDESAYCISGVMVEDPTYWAWGGGITFDLGGAEDDPTGRLQRSFDWVGARISGFRINYRLEGTQKVRILFSNRPAFTDGEVCPFIAARGSGTYVPSDAKVPATWDVPNKGESVGEDPIFSVRLQVVGADPGAGGPFKLCVDEFMPIE